MMRFAALLLIIFLCFPAFNSFCAETDSPSAQSVQADFLIPLTSEIFDMLYGATIYLERLDYYLSAPIGIVVDAPAKQEEILRIANGALLFEQKTPSEDSPPVIVVQSDVRGKLKSFFGTPKGSEIFEIEFGEPGKTSLLQFRRNNQNDLFELFSVFDVSTAKNYALRPDSIVPYLLIRSDRTGAIRTPATPNPVNNAPAPYTQTPQPEAVLPPQLPPPLPSYSAPTAAPPTYTAPTYVPPPSAPQPSAVQPSVAQPTPPPSAPQPEVARNDIMKSGTLSKNAITAFVRSMNSSVDASVLNNLVDTYIAEAASEQVNHDIAIAQMCFATSFLRNQDRMLMHDYAGLGRPLNYTGDYSLDMQRGVRAHIQHLKGYASVENPRQAIEDPRYDIIVRTGLRGKVTTFDDLYSRWAPLSPDYGQRINGIMREMTRF